MAAATEFSRPSNNDRILERSCSPNHSREVLCEIFRSLHTLAGQFERQQMELCSQPFLAKLQPVIKEENSAAIEEIGKTETRNKNELNAKFPPGDRQEEEKHKDCDLGDVKKIQVHFDSEVVQIKAGKAEIDRRISAFIERKQAEINENNVREFCNVIDCNQVSRVVNTYGPQTRPEGIQGSGHKSNSMLRDCGNQAVEERLQNIEAHLRLQSDMWMCHGTELSAKLFQGRSRYGIPDEVTFEPLKGTKHPPKRKQQEQSFPKRGNDVHQKGQSHKFPNPV
ncbi:MAP3K12-binding inhibitory protein 1 [Heterocephalus glaber]|uniref:MAP3K12-binding inhibitory protein 1 n=1 Tax=Heterocephalus glaber TaxID=10181 RepID=G5C2Q0_HETGA|nr:MAP3K12-binding inhibitory protein 1 [Heterocephalus glaber]